MQGLNIVLIQTLKGEQKETLRLMWSKSKMETIKQLHNEKCVSVYTHTRNPNQSDLNLSIPIFWVICFKTAGCYFSKMALNLMPLS